MRFGNWLLASALFGATSLPAQTPEKVAPSKVSTTPQASPEIVVSGATTTPEEARAVSRAFVRGVAAVPVSDQFARWRVPICPEVVGLSDEHGAIIIAKIRSVAQAAGVRVAKAKCQANLVVAFTDDGEAQMRAIFKRRAGIRVKMTPQERQLLSSTALPVRWWYVVEPTGKDGHQIGSSAAALLGATIQGSGPGFISNGESQFSDSYSSSLIGTSIRVNVDGASAIVDVNKAAGHTLNSVAAYVSLVTLARIKMDNAAGSNDSILGLFDVGGAGVTDLTPRDRAFLAALYRVPPNRDAREQSRQIAREMARIMSAS